MTTNEIILGAVALVLVVFSLVSAMVVPRRYEDFPARRMRLFLVVSVLLVLSMLAAVEVFGEERHGGESAAERQENVGPGTTQETEQPPPPPAAGGGGRGQEADPGAGEQLFVDQGCGGCHAFEAAGATGATGPNLDETLRGEHARPEHVRESIVEPNAEIAEGYQPDVMPQDYGEKLSDDQVADLVAFLTQGRG